MVNLLTLPAELRLHIYTFIPILHPTAPHPTSHPLQRKTPITPPICRTHPLLRHETLPLYASNNHFNASMDDGGTDSLQLFLSALGDRVHDVLSLQLQQHWKLQAPLRWQGHIGFYVRLERGGVVRAGTYPFVNDVRGMRSESLDLLKRVWKGGDVLVLVRLMEVVARHPIPAHGVEAGGEGGRRRRSSIFTAMEREMLEVVGWKEEVVEDVALTTD